MKNFRKVLALILVVATLFSFVAMASAKSATEYTDYADVQNVEAVDVLTALGIINGYDGAFHPADTIDRDEMAKMIAVLRNAGDFDASLYASANKFADVKGQWAEGYVAYCAQLGIIAGQNATTFAPDDAVKTVDVAKMLLCVLGFDAQKQGYVGPNYQVAVMRDAAKFDIIPAGVDPYAPATRDTAAQMFLNALKADLVIGYVGEGIVKATNSLYINNGRNQGVEWVDVSVYEAEKAGWEILSGTNAVISYTPLYTIFGAAASKTENVADCYGRPGTLWTITAGATTLLSKHYAYAADKSYSATATLTTDFAAELKAGYVVKFWNNGAPAGNAAGYTMTELLAGADEWTGTGINSWAYVNDTTKVITVYCAPVYIAKVSAVNEFAGTFTLVDTNKTATVLGTFKSTGVELKAGDMVLFTMCNGDALNHGTLKNNHAVNGALAGWAADLHDIAVVAPTVATVTAGHTVMVAGNKVANGSWVVADGKTYNYNANYGRVAQSLYAVTDTFDFAEAGKYSLYFDAAGNVMLALPYENTAWDYFYVVEGTAKHVTTGWVVDSVDGATVECTDTASLVKYTGTNGATLTPATESVDHSVFTFMKNTAGNVVDNASLAEQGIGRLARGLEKVDGTYVLEGAQFVVPGAQLTKGSNVIKDVKLGTGVAQDVYMDTATKIMIRTQLADGSYVYEEVVGYQNLTKTYMADTLYGGVYTNIQYFKNAKVTDTTYATHVFIDAKYAPATASTFFNMGEYALSVDFNIEYKGIYADDYYAYRALVDGVDSFVLVDKDLQNSGKLLKNKLYSDMVEYIGSAFAYEGKTLPLYRVVANADNQFNRDPINTNQVGIYVDANGAYQVQIHGTGKMWTVTENFKVITVMNKDPENPNTYNGYWVENPANLSGLTIKEGWVIYNAAGTQVEAIYRVAE